MFTLHLKLKTIIIHAFFSKQHFMVYCAQSYQNKTSIVPNLHSSLHMKLLLLFGGHLSIVRYLINFLRLHDTRTTTLIGNEN